MLYVTLQKKPKIATKEILNFIEKNDVITYLQLVAHFCHNNKDKELRKFVGHSIRQTMYLQIKRGTVKRISRGKYKYNII